MTDKIYFSKYVEKNFNSSAQFANDFDVNKTTVNNWRKLNRKCTVEGLKVTIYLDTEIRELNRCHFTTVKQSEYDDKLLQIRINNGKKGRESYSKKRKKISKINKLKHRELIIEDLKDCKSVLRHENHMRAIKIIGNWSRA